MSNLFSIDSHSHIHVTYINIDCQFAINSSVAKFLEVTLTSSARMVFDGSRYTEYNFTGLFISSIFWNGFLIVYGITGYVIELDNKI